MEESIVKMTEKYGMLLLVGGLFGLFYIANKYTKASDSSSPTGTIGVRG